MRTSISASELVRRLSQVLGRVRYGGESFVVEHHGTPVAGLGPVPGVPATTLGDAWRAWGGVAADDEFGDDLERVTRADRPPNNPWA